MQADIVIMETELPLPLYEPVCSLLRTMSPGSRLLTCVRRSIILVLYCVAYCVPAARCECVLPVRRSASMNAGRFGALRVAACPVRQTAFRVRPAELRVCECRYVDMREVWAPAGARFPYEQLPINVSPHDRCARPRSEPRARGGPCAFAVVMRT